MGNYDEPEADIDRPFDFLEENRQEGSKVTVQHEEGRTIGQIIAWDSSMNIYIKTNTGEELIRGSSIHNLYTVDNDLSDL